MSCNISRGRKETCNNQLGGIRNIYIVNFIKDIILGTNSGEITNVNAPNLDSNGKKAFKFEVSEGCSFEESITSSRNAGSTFYEGTLTVNLNKLSQLSSDLISILAKGRPQIFVEDHNNNMFLAGAYYGCDLTGGAITRGTGKADKNGYSLTFTTKEKEPSRMVIGSGNPNYADDVLSNIGINVQAIQVQ